MAESTDRIRLEAHWKAALAGEFDKGYMARLRRFLSAEKDKGKVIYPRGNEIFAALDTTPLPQVRVVIIGQDPYHGPGQAHGLCFSVRNGVPPPPSLVNIFKEIGDEFGQPVAPGKGCLIGWARQGVLLLNSVLTVEQGRAGSHQGRGWETFTDQVVEVLSGQRKHLVFMLWGSYAQRKGAIVDRNQHCVLSSPHPSPLSAHRGFFGCGHFRQANLYLERHQLSPVDWYAEL